MATNDRQRSGSREFVLQLIESLSFDCSYHIVPVMTHFFRTLIMVVVIAALSGCSTHRMAERVRLPLHPVHERRMTNQATAGYVPTGVWRVRGASSTVYLAGTCHVVDDDEIPFPSAYYAAYRDSKELLVETDPLSFSGAWLMMKAAAGETLFFRKHSSEFYCPKDKSVEDYVAPETARLLREFSPEDYEWNRRFTPLGLAFFARKYGTRDGEGGVDEVFALLAHRDGKRIRSLDNESAPKLMGPNLEAALDEVRSKIASQGADAVLKEYYTEQDKGSEGKKWRYGDMSFAAPAMAEFKRREPELYDKMGPERNRQWFPAIQRALAGKRNVMVLVGALHLTGEDGLIEMLRREGFKPEQMYGIDRPAQKREGLHAREQ
jgi:uncharacterized protein